MAVNCKKLKIGNPGGVSNGLKEIIFTAVNCWSIVIVAILFLMFWKVSLSGKSSSAGRKAYLESLLKCFCL